MNKQTCYIILFALFVSVIRVTAITKLDPNPNHANAIISMESRKIRIYTGTNGESSLYCMPYEEISINTVHTEFGLDSKRTQDLKKVCDSRNYCLPSTFSRYLKSIKPTIRYYCGSKNVQKLYNIFDSHLVHNVNEKTGTVEYCKRKIVKRQNKNVIHQESGGIHYLDDIIGMYRALGDARAFGYNSETFTPTQQSATRYTVTYTTQHYRNNQLVTLPIYVAATIRYHHTQNQRPSTIPDDVRNQLRQMDVMSDDDAGHILAHSLGGRTIPSNFVPMNRDVNRIRGNWYRTENDLRAYLNREKHGYIEWDALVIYPNEFRNYRPIGFIVRYILFDGHGQQIGEPDIRAFLNDPENFQNYDCTHGLKDFFLNK